MLPAVHHRHGNLGGVRVVDQTHVPGHTDRLPGVGPFRDERLVVHLREVGEEFRAQLLGGDQETAPPRPVEKYRA
ncbi:MAG TPA: hypothetical protein VJU79_10990 [Candidatus Dormibacteraeota bacterium]|nr:hypothetical protein [Candidatus Dormibacteraeota bacterium]